LLIVLTPLCVSAAGPAEDAAKKELKKFQGAWQAVSVQYADGKMAPEAEVRVTRLSVEGNRFTLTSKDFTVSGTFHIDPTKKPKVIDVVLEGAKPEEKFLGIYQIEGDRRKGCFALPGKDRPQEFKTGTKGTIQFEWKRLTP
jgi:uncharacterized protein (TIGR03067 family)